jgi:uncharacterized protein (TIGR00369 family)
MTFDDLLEIEIEELTPSRASCRLAVRPALLTTHGEVGTGVFAAVAESLTWAATAHAVGPDGAVPIAISNNTDAAEPVTGGMLQMTAELVDASAGVWTWRVDAGTDGGKRCALSVVRLAVRRSPLGKRLRP